MNRRQFLQRAAAATATLAAGGLGYARFEATWVHVTRHTLAVPRLPAPFAGMKVALISDMHHGPFNTRSLLRTAVDRTNALRPDLVALPGDFVQGHNGSHYAGPCLRELGRLRAPLGVFAVPGNHDYWGGIQVLRRAIADSGIVDVTNTGRWVERGGSRLWVGGVDDLWEGRPHLPAALGDATTADACLLLCHNPDYVETLRDRRVGLVLSGHMHGGQIVIPGVGYHRIPSRYGLKYLQGLVRTPHTQVFVSRGLGTTALPLRFRCRPEVNLLTLTNA